MQDENDAGVLYSGLISCQQRFQHYLDSSLENDNIKGSLCLGGTTLPLPAPVVRALNISEIDDGQPNLGKEYFTFCITEGTAVKLGGY